MIIILFILVLLFPAQSWAAYYWSGNTCTVSAGAQSDFESCVSEAASKTGEVIISIAASTVDWTSESTVTMTSWTNVTKLTVQGAGTTSTVITAARNGKIIGFTTGSKYLVVKDLGIKGGTSSYYHNWGILSFSGDNWRLTNVAFSEWQDVGNDSWAVVCGGNGLIDNCTFTPSSESGGGIMLWGSSNGWPDWKTAISWGSVNFTFIENNTFTWPEQNTGTPEILLDAYGGAKWVFRYNTVYNTNLGVHGLDSTVNTRSPLAFEVYNNTFSSNNTYIGNFPVRGGTGLVYSNTYSGTAPWTGPTLQYFRACEGANVSAYWQYSYNTSDLKVCSNLATDGTYTGNIQTCNDDGDCTASTCNRMFLSTNKDQICTVGDSNCTYHFDGDGSLNYPGRDQPGYGPNQTLQPVYVWSNDSKNAGGGGSCANEATYIQANREYCNASPASDCGATSGWSYAAYTYPHPLRGPAAAQNPRLLGGTIQGGVIR